MVAHLNYEEEEVVVVVAFYLAMAELVVVARTGRGTFYALRRKKSERDIKIHLPIIYIYQ